VNPVDPAACVGRLAALARRALTQADAYPPVDVLCCALAGAGRAELREAVRAELAREQIARSVVVITDAEAALADAFDDAPGILLIAGTGSIAWGRGEDGRLERCGGWGALLGDEGSGYAIGLAGLRASVRAEDGRAPATQLRAELLRTLELRETSELIGWVAHASKAAVAALAPVVLQAAAAGDDVACTLRDEAASALVAHVTVLRERLGPWRGAADVAFAGGLIRPGRPLRDALSTALRASGASVRIREQTVDAARGATRLARRSIAP
ncbi:MAG: N-acetylglucosamine kinase, partial [Longimicrobiales bacterium]